MSRNRFILPSNVSLLAALTLKTEDPTSAAVEAALARLDEADVPLGRGAAGLLSLTEEHKNSQKEKETGRWSFCRPAAAPERGLHTQLGLLTWALPLSTLAAGSPVCLASHFGLI